MKILHKEMAKGKTKLSCELVTFLDSRRTLTLAASVKVTII